MSSFDHKFEFSEGPPVSSSGSSIESGTFTLSADGSTVTGTGVTVVNSGGGVFVLTIPTIKKLKELDIQVYATSLGSDGSTTGKYGASIQFCSGYSYSSVSGSSTPFFDPSNILSIENFGAASNDGWNGLLISTTDTTMVFTLTKSGSGVDITGQWIATTG